MFVQVIEGRVRDLEGLRRQFDTWMSELAPGADGYLGSTAGVAPDGTFVAVARFESQEAVGGGSDDARFVQIIGDRGDRSVVLPAGDSAQPSPEDHTEWERLSSLMEFDRFLDLSDRWLYSR